MAKWRMHFSRDRLGSDRPSPRRLVPIHSFETARFAEFFDKVDRKEDGVWWDV